MKRMGSVSRALNATSRTKSNWLTEVLMRSRSLFGLSFHVTVRARDSELGPKAGPEHARFLAVGNVPE
jgi:hypothetical protein